MIKEDIKRFIDRSLQIDKDNLQFTGNGKAFGDGFISSYKDLSVQISFGKGNWASVTWIGFLYEGQKVQKGIYPVLLFYRNERILILAYGVSSTNPPAITWNIEGKTSIKDYFKSIGCKSKKYLDSYIFKTYDKFESDADYSLISKDIDQLVGEYKSFMSKIITGASPAMDNSFSISSIISLIASTGLQYDPALIKRFAFSLMAKPFVILSGLAGSGKTQLALAFAKALIADSGQMCVVSVGADWTNREPLLGYPNALKSDEYVKPESGALELLIEASKSENAKKPYFLILDEMNMSYVERYFADFLSAMESHESIRLWSGAEGKPIPDSVKLPKNLFIIGTINVDETTYMFSPKVLDRANVIEFKISGDEMDSFLGNIRSIDQDALTGKAAGMAESFIDKATSAQITPDEEIKKALIRFFNQLKTVNAEFGYRSATEIYRYIDIASHNDDTDNKADGNEILDSAMVQKLLPKLHGSRKKLVPVLKALWGFCTAECNLDDATTVPDNTLYPLTADKVLRMYRSAIDNGFTSYSEA